MLDSLLAVSAEELYPWNGFCLHLPAQHLHGAYKGAEVFIYLFADDRPTLCGWPGRVLEIKSVPPLDTVQFLQLLTEREEASFRNRRFPCKHPALFNLIPLGNLIYIKTLYGVNISFCYIRRLDNDWEACFTGVSLKMNRPCWFWQVKIT